MTDSTRNVVFPYVSDTTWMQHHSLLHFFHFMHWTLLHAYEINPLKKYFVQWALHVHAFLNAKTFYVIASTWRSTYAPSMCSCWILKLGCGLGWESKGLPTSGLISVTFIHQWGTLVGRAPLTCDCILMKSNLWLSSWRSTALTSRATAAPRMTNAPSPFSFNLLAALLYVWDSPLVISSFNSFFHFFSCLNYLTSMCSHFWH